MDIEKIREGLKKPGKTQRGLATALGLDPSAVSRLLKGERQLKAAEADQVRAYLEVDTDSATPDPLPPGEEMTEAPMLRRADMPLDVPVLGTAVGGSMGDFSINGQVVDYIRRPPSLAAVKQAFAIFYANDSMWPLYEPGDPIYINPSRPPRPGDYVLIEMHGLPDGSPGAAYVKRLVKKTEKVVIVAQYNPPRDDIRYETGKIKNVWRIVPTRELLSV